MTTATIKKGKTIADLRAAHDTTVIVPNRIRQALAALKTSGDIWAYEHEFIAIVKPPISGANISKYRDQFADFWAELPTTNGKGAVRRAWFATKAAADEWKETIGG
jgi:hypothetical protein